MSNNFRIAFISDHASPLASPGSTDSGGQNVYVAETAKQLAKMGYSIDIFTRMENEHAASVVDWLPGVRVIHVKAGPAKIIPKEDILCYMPEFRDNLVAFITEEAARYDLVHAHFFMSGWVALELKRLLSIPFTVTFHALGRVRKIHQAENDRFPAERIEIEKAVIRGAEKIIAECPQDKSDLENLYQANPEKITIVPCGFSSAEFYPVNKDAARKKLGIAGDDFVLLQLGRMVPRKGIDNVIRAAGSLKGSASAVKLLVVGGECPAGKQASSPELLRLAAIAEDCGIREAVSFTGRKSRDLLKYYYAAADIFITTPWYEPFGITPLEAMACGLPVIGANVGGIKYSVVHGETGFLVPPNDPLALSEKIALLMEDRTLLKTMRFNALMHVNTHFKWDHIAALLSNVYRDMIFKWQTGQLVLPSFESIEAA
ncbi:glycosyltransferase [Hufsiella ginkgonis]|uniref:Glycosyltransferase n=1 Tax=Hufsiella ginkgonis TaxID=2695274 RepID=A0A7K1Y0W7_9SPHI|nr:glycosyltransferase [Hufsiella ginkgonis]MXV16679.1 glycosyltransferase [Hufsiella ginkgonis]